MGYLKREISRLRSKDGVYIYIVIPLADICLYKHMHSF